MSKKKLPPIEPIDTPDWIDTPGLKHILEEDVPLAGKLLKEGRKHIIIRGNLRTGKSHIRDRIRKKSTLKPLDEDGLNCAALNPNLIESELFGHKKGAFTGADKDKPGLLQDKSDPPKVLFLEEIGELPEYIQAKLLVFLETGTFMPVGGTFFKNKNGKNDKKHSTICIIATSNAKNDKFRDDFLARFWPVNVPPIHERREDIPKFLEYFLHGDEKKLLPQDWFYLLTYNWPGGVSEIEDICIQIKYYLFEHKQTHRYNFVKRLLHLKHDFGENYFDFCSYNVDKMKDNTIAKLFPHFGLSQLSFNKPAPIYEYHALIREWEAWCDFFGQNRTSPDNTYEYKQDQKPAFVRIKNWYNFLSDPQSFLIKNNPMYEHFLDFFKEQGLTNDEGVTLLNDLKKKANDELLHKKKNENNTKTEQQLSFENTKPKDYTQQFWEYQVKHGRSGADVNKRYGIKRKTANDNILKAKERIES